LKPPLFLVSMGIVTLGLSLQAYAEDDKKDRNTQHNFAMSMGTGYLANTTLRTYYSTYLDQNPGRQDFTALRYMYLYDDDAIMSSGIALDIFRASSEEGTQTRAGDIKVSYKLMGLGIGRGWRQMTKIEGLAATASIQLAFIQEDIGVNTTVGSVLHKDAQGSELVDNLLIKLKLGTCYTVWNRVGVTADIDWLKSVSGYHLLTISAGVNYAL
jgi:hypothetical protein